MKRSYIITTDDGQQFDSLSAANLHNSRLKFAENYEAGDGLWAGDAKVSGKDLVAFIVANSADIRKILDPHVPVPRAAKATDAQ